MKLPKPPQTTPLCRTRPCTHRSHRGPRGPKGPKWAEGAKWCPRRKDCQVDGMRECRMHFCCYSTTLWIPKMRSSCYLQHFEHPSSIIAIIYHHHHHRRHHHHHHHHHRSSWPQELGGILRPEARWCWEAPRDSWRALGGPSGATEGPHRVSIPDS